MRLTMTFVRLAERRGQEYTKTTANRRMPKTPATAIAAQNITGCLLRQRPAWSIRLMLHQQITRYYTDMDQKVIRAQLIEQLKQLRTTAGYYNAGIPNYEHLFGRDSCISALEVLHFDDEPARATLDVLAEFVGKRQALWREEYRGKILHEHYPGGWT